MEIVREGQLSKHGALRKKRVISRWYILESCGTLYYCKDEKDDTYRGEIKDVDAVLLEEATVGESEASKTGLLLVTQLRTFKLFAPTKEDQMGWYYDLKAFARHQELASAYRASAEGHDRRPSQRLVWKRASAFNLKSKRFKVKDIVFVPDKNKSGVIERVVEKAAKVVFNDRSVLWRAFVDLKDVQSGGALNRSASDTHRSMRGNSDRWIADNWGHGSHHSFVHSASMNRARSVIPAPRSGLADTRWGDGRSHRLLSAPSGSSRQSWYDGSLVGGADESLTEITGTTDPRGSILRRSTNLGSILEDDDNDGGEVVGGEAGQEAGSSSHSEDGSRHVRLSEGKRRGRENRDNDDMGQGRRDSRSPSVEVRRRFSGMRMMEDYVVVQRDDSSEEHTTRDKAPREGLPPPPPSPPRGSFGSSQRMLSSASFFSLPAYVEGDDDNAFVEELKKDNAMIEELKKEPEQAWLLRLRKTEEGENHLIAQRYTEAARCFRFAARLHSCTGAGYLGIMTKSGIGLPRNDDHARVWFQIARKLKLEDACSSEASAQYIVGRMLLTGWGGWKQNVYVARKMFLAAAKQFHPDSMYQLADMHRYGVAGLSRDESIAIALLNEAASRGHILAQRSLERMELRHG